MQVGLLILGLLSLWLFVVSLRKVKAGHFFGDSLSVSWFGIYVWGDGLVLFPFWAVLLLSAGIFGINLIWILRAVVLLYVFRSFFEVIFWLQKQSVHSDFKPVVLRKFPKLTAEAAQIVFQLFHTCLTVLGILLFLGSFFW